MSNHFAGLHGGGPWRILDNCLAPLHNSLRAAEGRNRAPRCICPRALVIRRARQNRWNELRSARRVEGRAIKTIQPGHMIPRANKVTEPMPDMSQALCRRPDMMKVMDKGFGTGVSEGAQAARQAAKDVCSFCPIAETVCGPYVERAEKPAGSWGGIWAGRDPWERMGLRLVIKDGSAEVLTG